MRVELSTVGACESYVVLHANHPHHNWKQTHTQQELFTTVAHDGTSSQSMITGFHGRGDF